MLVETDDKQMYYFILKNWDNL